MAEDTGRGGRGERPEERAEERPGEPAEERPGERAEERAEERAGERSGETPEQRRRRLAAVFGEVLPESTSDDRDEPGRPETGAGDRWLREQVPPHHGD